MSATTETLYEKIRNLESLIEECRSSGKDTSQLLVELSNCKKQLEAANSALNESKQILKG